ncbi:MAG: hypothetical protein KGO93_02560 [Cyanobacteria bacterium REEB446]|jgi:hypothetical protein|nr:hypothetical protein [Cyanobacteria bacterium REEB446]
MIIRFLIAVLFLQAFTVIPCEAIKLEDIEIVRYDPEINNSAIYNFSLKQPINENLTKDAKFQITYIYTPEYCQRKDLQKQYPEIPYEFACNLNKNKLPFILGEFKAVDKLAYQAINQVTKSKNYTKLQITNIVTQDYLKGLTKANFIKRRFDRTAYFGDNARLANLWNHVLFSYIYINPELPGAYHPLNAFLDRNQGSYSCSHHYYNCVFNNDDINAEHQYYNLNQLHQLSSQGQITKNDLQELFHTDILTDSQGNFLGLTYSLQADEMGNPRALKPIQDKPANKIFIKNGNFKIKPLFKNTKTSKILKVSAIPFLILLAPILIPVALYQIGSAGQ